MVDFLKIIKEYGDTDAFVIMDGENGFNVSYTRFYNELERCAFNLKKTFGNVNGRHIGIYVDTSYEYTVLLGAIMFSRGVAVPLNIRESSNNIVYEIKNADLDFIIVDDAHKSVLKDCADIMCINKRNLLDGEFVETGLSDFSDDEEDNIALIVYTSGTTGFPKGVVISVGNLFKNPKEMYDENVDIEKTRGLRIYDNFPFYHIGGINGWITRMEKGCTTYLSVNIGNVLSDLKKVRIDCASVIPTTLNLWEKAIKRGHIEKLGGVKLVATGGAPASINTVNTFLDNGIKYGQYYGMTESSGNITLNFDCAEHLKSVGRADKNVELTIVDGEICVSGDGIATGYYKHDIESKETFDGNILHTGDLGFVDDDGYVYITGRKKNLIILSSGENVSPEELEKELRESDNIIECKVFAENDRMCVQIYAESGKEGIVKQYIEELNRKLPIYKRIYKTIIQNDPLERTHSGKIKR